MRRYDFAVQNIKNSSFSQSFGCTEISVTDNRRAIIDGAKGIIEYTPCCVRLNIGKLCLRFCGEGLCIKTLSDDKIVVEGTIISMDFSS